MQRLLFLVIWTSVTATGPFPGEAPWKWQAPSGDALLEIEIVQDYVGQLASGLH